MTRLSEIEGRISRRKTATDRMWEHNLLRDPYSVVNTPEYEAANAERWAASNDYYDHHQDDLSDLVAFAKVVRDAMESGTNNHAILDQIHGALYELENP